MHTGPLEITTKPSLWKNLCDLCIRIRVSHNNSRYLLGLKLRVHTLPVPRILLTHIQQFFEVQVESTLAGVGMSEIPNRSAREQFLFAFLESVKLQAASAWDLQLKRWWSKTLLSSIDTLWPLWRIYSDTHWACSRTTSLVLAPRS